MSSDVTIFTVHTRYDGRDRSVRLIPHGFCWAAFLFGPAWLLAKRLWLAAALVAAADVAVVVAIRFRLLEGGAGLVALALIALLAGLEGREWLRRAEAKRGSALAGVAFGASETEALAWAASLSRQTRETQS